MNAELCVESLTPYDGYHSRRCSKRVKVRRGGKGYCTIHDPRKVQERRSKRDARWDASFDISETKAKVVKRAADHPDFVDLFKKLDDAVERWNAADNT